MTILESFIEQHQGRYYSEPVKVTYGVSGNFRHQFEKGQLDYLGCSFEFSFNSGGSAGLIIRTKLDQPLTNRFSVYTRAYWGRVFHRLWPNWKYRFPHQIHQYYQFNGDQNLIQSFRNNQRLMDLMTLTNVCFNNRNTDPVFIKLMPTNGFQQTGDLELFCQLLAEVKKSIETSQTKPY